MQHAEPHYFRQLLLLYGEVPCPMSCPLSMMARNTPVLARGAFSKKKPFPFVLAGLGAKALHLGKTKAQVFLQVTCPSGAPSESPATLLPQAALPFDHRYPPSSAGSPGPCAAFPRGLPSAQQAARLLVPMLDY